MKVQTIVLAGIALALVGTAPVSSPSSAWAQEQPKDQMMPGMKMGQGKAAGMPPACQEMMAMRQSMRAEQASADAKLNDLVAKMNAASGPQKVDAIAAVVSEMVAQRQARHEKMATMQGKMKRAMADCPADCPMMKMQQGGGAGAAKPEQKSE